MIFQADIEHIKNFLCGFKFNHLFKPHSNEFICEAVCCFMFFPAINFFLNYILQTYFAANSISFLFYGFLGILGFASYFFVFPKGNKSVIFIAVFLLLSTFFSYLLYPDISEVFIGRDFNPLTSALIGIPLFQIPAFVYASRIQDWHFFVSRIHFFSIITVLLGIVSFYFFTIVSFSEDVPNYMVFSYHLLIGLAPLLYFFLTDKSVLGGVLVLLGFLCIIIVGARGAQFSFLLVLLLSIFFTAKNKKRTLVVLGLSLVFISFLLKHPEYLQNMLNKYLGDYGISSRTLSKLSDGTFLSTSGRDVLKQIVIGGIWDNPIGYGVFGDRYLTATRGWGEPAYCHNIILELCCDFGVIIGCAIFIALIFSIFRDLLRGGYNGKSQAILLILPCGFFELFFSNSYLLCIPFFILLGVLFASPWSMKYRNL